MKRFPHPRTNRGFTLVEMIVSVSVLTILILVLTSLISALRLAITGTTSQIAQFQQARDAFETMTRRISQATLNSYDDADPHLTGTSPYARTSELRFISGNANTLISPAVKGIYPTQAMFFNAPLGYTVASGTSTAYAGMVNLINTCGYFIQWGSDQAVRPGFLPTSIPLRWRMRLMELLEPSDYLTIYKDTSGSYTAGNIISSKSWYYNGQDWFQNPLSPSYQTSLGKGAQVHAIAENIVFLAFLPMVAPGDAQIPPGGEADGSSTDLMLNQASYTYDTSPSQDAATSLPVTQANLTVQNQLPPLVYIIMIAVDEKSFYRFQASRGASQSGDPSIALGLNNILTNPSYTNRMTDIAQVTAALSGTNQATGVHTPIDYRIFAAAGAAEPQLSAG